MEYLSSRPLRPWTTRRRPSTRPGRAELFALSFENCLSSDEFNPIEPRELSLRPARGTPVLLDGHSATGLSLLVGGNLSRLLRAGSQNDIAGLRAASQQIGYIGPGTPAQQIDLLLPIMNAAFGHCGPRTASLLLRPAVRLRDQAMALGLRRVPGGPANGILYLHRKFGELYLLARRMRAQVDIQMAAPCLRTGSST